MRNYLLRMFKELTKATNSTASQCSDLLRHLLNASTAWWMVQYTAVMLERLEGCLLLTVPVTACLKLKLLHDTITTGCSQCCPIEGDITSTRWTSYAFHKVVRRLFSVVMDKFIISVKCWQRYTCSCGCEFDSLDLSRSFKQSRLIKHPVQIVRRIFFCP